MSSIAVVRWRPDFNNRSRGPRPEWWTWLGILISAALFAAFCMWVFVAVRANDDARCREATADIASHPQTITVDDSRSESSTESDDGDVCLIRRDAIAR